uniref:Uncharacterized protein n=1 Tax=Lepeophtheirus salmonis TaxID=72036 RepID=A0A0K2T4C7_LEPSM
MWDGNQTNIMPTAISITEIVLQANRSAFIMKTFSLLSFL